MNAHRPRTRPFLGHPGRSGVFAIALLSYAASSPAATNTITFNTPAAHVWTVPAGVTSIQVDVYGAQGGNGPGGHLGGLGGQVLATLSVTPGQVIQLTVGGAGGVGNQFPGVSTPGAGGFNGGATGGHSLNRRGSGGGGASDVRIGGCAATATCAFGDRVLVAGGGGGAGGSDIFTAGGGVGGGSTGVPGQSSNGGFLLRPPGGGGGGTQSGGGAGGQEDCGASNNCFPGGTQHTPGTNGSLGNGGAGGNGGNGGAGGGGGGYYGGGGGGGGNRGAGGGGGSGFISNAPAVSNGSFPGGTETGDGRIVISYTLPDVSINQASGQADPTSGSPIHFTAVFSEAVTGFDGTDVTLSGTAGATTIVVTEIAPNNGTSYDVAVSGMTSSGTVVASIPAGAASAASNGNPSEASTSIDNTVTFVLDVTPPSVTIVQASGQADPTNTSPILFTVTFSEPVADFTDSDVTLSGTAGATTVVVTEGAPNDGTTYDVEVSGMTADGTVIAEIAADAAHDAAGNGSTASTTTDNTVTYDTGRPSVTVNQAPEQVDPTNASPIKFKVVFSEPVGGFGTAELSGTAGATTLNFSQIAPNDGTTYLVEVSGMTNDGTVILTVPEASAFDAAFNINTASTSTDNTVTYDTTPPAVTINQASGQADPTSVSPIHFTAVFNSPVADFATGDVTLGGTAGATTATVTEIAPNDDTTFDVEVSGMTGAGTVTASIGANAAHDAAGNGNPASTSTDNTVTFTTGSANLCGNPGFEDNLNGWIRYPDSHVTLSRLLGTSGNPAHGGNYMLLIKSTDDETFGCDDQPNWVSPVAGAGTRYKFTAWVKSTTNTSKAKLRVVELTPNGSQVGSTVYSNEVSLSTGWKLLTAFITVQRATSSLSMRITESPSSSGKSFAVDDVAIEVAPRFTIVSSAGSGGTISPSGSRTVDSGTNQTYTIKANSGYHIDDVLVDNVSIGPQSSYTFTNVTANHTIAASFAVNPPGINLVGNPGFESDLSGWAKYPNSSSVTLSRVLGTSSTVNGAHGGNYVLRIRSSSESTFGCDDSPNWVSPAAAGATYQVTAWVKSLDNTSRVKIRVSEVESDGDQVQSVSSNEPSLSTSWRLLTAFITIQRSNSSLSIRITETPSSSGKSFLVDDVSIELVPGTVAARAASQPGGAELEGALTFRALVTPNPARGAALLRLATTAPGPLRVRLFDVNGRVQQVLIDEPHASPGERSVALRTRGRGRIEPGVYFYRVEAGEGTLTGRWVVLE